MFEGANAATAEKNGGENALIKKIAILQSARQGNLGEGKGKEFPCCTCWRLKHGLEIPAGTMQSVRRGTLKCPRCCATPPLSLTDHSSLKNLNIHIDPQP